MKLWSDWCAMADVAAIARLMATGGRATQMLADLNRQAREAVDQLSKLERLTPAAAKVGQSLEQLHRHVTSTGQLTTQEFETYRNLAGNLQYIAREAARQPARPRGSFVESPSEYGRPLTA